MIDFGNPRVATAVICAVGLLAYHNCFENGFHYDDSHSLVDNPHIRTLSNVGRFFYDPGTFSAMPEARMYRPVLLVSYAVNHALGEYDQFGYHLVNLLLHLANASLVWLVATALLKRSEGALIAALLFVCHPLLSEPVNYISSRSSLLATLFFLLAFRVLIDACRRGSGPRHHLLVTLFCAASLGSKSIAIVFPAVAAVYAATAARHGQSRRVSAEDRTTPRPEHATPPDPRPASATRAPAASTRDFPRVPIPG